MYLVLKWQDYRKFCVNCILEIHGILNMSQVLKIPRFPCIRNLNIFTGYIERVVIYLGFCICQSFESVLETTLKNNFKFKYPNEALKKDISGVYMT